jgi:CxxC-x17-CxxC domain-containing protein
MGFQDKSLACADCGASFVFTAAEQEFHSQKGFQNEPRRCPECREKRRRERPGGGAKPMTKVMCAACGAETEVPFVPRGNKPVYCRACFDKQRGGR